MKRLFQLTEDDFIAMAKLIDNDFIGNVKIIVTTKLGATRVVGHTDGKQCINCDVKFKIKNGVEFIGAYIQNDSECATTPYREVMPDITMCTNRECPQADNCWRFGCPPSQHLQSYCRFEPEQDDEDDFKCSNKIEYPNYQNHNT